MSLSFEHFKRTSQVSMNGRNTKTRVNTKVKKHEIWYITVEYITDIVNKYRYTQNRQKSNAKKIFFK